MAVYRVLVGGAAAQKASRGAQEGAKRAAANSVSGITVQVNAFNNLTIYNCNNVHPCVDLLNSAGLPSYLQLTVAVHLDTKC